ncbi:uncharacterized protein BO95DRAFT_443668 [Aspergillus brunneoviolaceus CBS 621.78]|uniref:Uncharacterized protein n=1 Tax=Aspergillus brunneoviolaceus CBS 621.78 TaxID=1450534 RepID=A0ACD1G6T4_9EURO|nr:hypothetical protein BO95DRAFT_443668 [Aspergillus brunneoviolaceus CBS 621.78]RAH44949.1 hypothetical protein BO95DRAFT_443668 [Aspergillus brunneoviolaceus CBS 621.78]
MVMRSSLSQRPFHLAVSQANIGGGGIFVALSLCRFVHGNDKHDSRIKSTRALIARNVKMKKK